MKLREIADFLDIDTSNADWDAILEHCSFNYMKEHAEASVPLGGIFWDGGAKSFIHKGNNGRWRDVLTEEESAKYEQLAVEKLGPECARWLQTGEM